MRRRGGEHQIAMPRRQHYTRNPGGSPRHVIATTGECGGAGERRRALEGRDLLLQLVGMVRRRRGRRGRGRRRILLRRNGVC